MFRLTPTPTGSGLDRFRLIDGNWDGMGDSKVGEQGVGTRDEVGPVEGV